MVHYLHELLHNTWWNMKFYQFCSSLSSQGFGFEAYQIKDTWKSLHCELQFEIHVCLLRIVNAWPTVKLPLLDYSRALSVLLQNVHLDLVLSGILQICPVWWCVRDYAALIFWCKRKLSLWWWLLEMIFLRNCPSQSTLSLADCVFKCNIWQSVSWVDFVSLVIPVFFVLPCILCLFEMQHWSLPRMRIKLSKWWVPCFSQHLIFRSELLPYTSCRFSRNSCSKMVLKH